MGYDGSFFYVKPPEVEVVEVDGEDAGSDLFEADELAAEELADVDPSRVPSDPAVGADLSDLEVSRVVGQSWRASAEVRARRPRWGSAAPGLRAVGRR